MHDVPFNGKPGYGTSPSAEVSYSPLAYTFDELPNGIYIGSRKSSRYFNGVIAYLACWKGVFTPEEIKYCYNNGLFNNPSTQLLDKYSLELFVDFQNPFNDGGTIKLPDLSPNNHDINLISGFGGTVAGVEAALEDITELF